MSSDTLLSVAESAQPEEFRDKAVQALVNVIDESEAKTKKLDTTLKEKEMQVETLQSELERQKAETERVKSELYRSKFNSSMAEKKVEVQADRLAKMQENFAEAQKTCEKLGAQLGKFKEDRED